MPLKELFPGVGGREKKSQLSKAVLLLWCPARAAVRRATGQDFTKTLLSKHSDRSWEVLHHATNTEATVCEHLQQSGVCKHEATIRRHVQSTRTTLLLFRLAGSDCRLRFAGLWPSGAVTRPKLLQSRKARARNWQAETRSNAVLPSKESE